MRSRSDITEKWKRETNEQAHNLAERHRYHSEMQSRDCQHDMVYSGTLGVVGGYCRNCGYKTY